MVGMRQRLEQLAQFLLHDGGVAHRRADPDWALRRGSKVSEALRSLDVDVSILYLNVSTRTVLHGLDGDTLLSDDDTDGKSVLSGCDGADHVGVILTTRSNVMSCSCDFVSL